LQKQAETTIPPSKLPGRGQSTTEQRLDIGVGDGFLGRAVDPLGRPLDGGPVPQSNRRRALEASSPPITARDFVDRPLLSGSKMVDTLIPIGEGERQLIIGDAGTGRSALGLETVIAQKGRDVLCVHVPAAIRRWD
jgi:F-type H+-transporting ATPase subunit alpha